MTAPAGTPGGPPLLVEAAYVLPEPGRTVPDGAVLLRDGCVVEVGAALALRAAHPKAARLGGPNRLCTAGLVNAHSHGKAVDAAGRGLPDQPLERWIHTLAGGPDIDPHANALWTDVCLLEAGVTTALHHCYEPTAAAFERVFAAHRASGIRTTVALGISNQNRLVHDGQAALLASLPADVRPAAEALAAVKHGDGDAWLALARDLATRHARGRMRIALGPSGLQWVDDALWRRIAETAQALGCAIHTHVAESPLERAHARRVYGASAVAHLARLGVLGPRTSLAHGVWLEPGDGARLAATGTTIVHNPGSNLRLFNGVAPVRELLAAGVAVAMGTDDTTLAGTHDLLAEARFAWRLHRPPDPGALPIPADTIHAMLTTAGARAAGHGPGTLTPGAPADLVLWDLPALLAPLPGLPTGVAETWLARGSATHVDTVLVGGEVCVRGGRHVAPDRDAWRAAFARDAAAAPRRHALAGAAVRVWPWLERFYAAWLQGDGAPPRP